MYRNTKVATCSYCGTRAALVLDAGRHELVCASCGAPLHELKALPVRRETVDAPGPGPGSKSGPMRERPMPSDRGVPRHRWSDYERARKPSKPHYRKRRKSFTKKLFEEAFDLIEDIFD